MISRIIFRIPFLLLFCTILSCRQEPKDTPISGAITIYSDEAFKPVIDAEIETFEALYKNARVQVSYLPENRLFDYLIKDSTELIITGRRLNKQELEYFSSEQALVNEFHFATDAVALITSQKFNNYLTDSLLLRGLFSGTFARWRDLNPEWPADSVVLVVDQSNSANLQYIRNTFGLNTEKVRIYAAGTDKDVIDYVKQTPVALGVIGSAWVNDEEAAAAKNLRNGIHFIRIKAANTEYGPGQHSLADESNPLARAVYIIRRNKNSGLSAGFTSFLLSERGQRIVLKAGIMPAVMPGREIIVR